MRRFEAVTGSALPGTLAKMIVTMNQHEMRNRILNFNMEELQFYCGWETLKIDWIVYTRIPI